MSEVKHTPGPWFASGNGYTVTTDDRDITIATCHLVDGDENNTAMEANANVIAAAPDLLVALKRAVLLYYLRLDVAARMRQMNVPTGKYVPAKAQWVTEAEIAIAKAEPNKLKV